jgi:hypothetical protein
VKQKLRRVKPVRVKKEPVAIMQVYIDPEIYEKMRACAEEKYVSIAGIARQVVGKRVKARESKRVQSRYSS